MDFVLRRDDLPGSEGVFRRSGQLRGREEFRGALEYFRAIHGEAAIKGVKGDWGAGDNLVEFNRVFRDRLRGDRDGNDFQRALQEGSIGADEWNAALRSAALATPTGKWAAKEFSNVEIQRQSGFDPNTVAFDHIVVVFHKSGASGSGIGGGSGPAPPTSRGSPGPATPGRPSSAGAIDVNRAPEFARPSASGTGPGSPARPPPAPQAPRGQRRQVRRPRRARRRRRRAARTRRAGPDRERGCWHPSGSRACTEAIGPSRGSPRATCTRRRGGTPPAASWGRRRPMDSWIATTGRSSPSSRPRTSSGARPARRGPALAERPRPAQPARPPRRHRPRADPARSGAGRPRPARRPAIAATAAGAAAGRRGWRPRRGRPIRRAAVDPGPGGVFRAVRGHLVVSARVRPQSDRRPRYLSSGMAGHSRAAGWRAAPARLSASEPARDRRLQTAGRGPSRSPHSPAPPPA